MKIVSCVFPITLGRPLENAEKIKDIAENTPGDIYLFPAYALGGVSVGKAKTLPYFKEESAKALDILCDYTENNGKCIVTSTFSEGNIAVYGGDVNKSGKFTFKSKTVSVSQSGNDSADIVLVPTAMPSYPCIKNDVSEFCAAISRQKNCVVAVSNAGYGESSADDVFKGFCGVFKNGTITAFMSEDKPEKITASADFDKADGIMYARPKRAADKIPYYTKNDTSIFVSDFVLLQKQALYSRIKAFGYKKIFIDGTENSETAVALHIISETAKDLKLKSEKVTVFTSSDIISSLASFYGFTVSSSAAENTRIRKAEIFDLADKEKAIVVGSTTISDIAYGKINAAKENLCHYNVNASLPRTLIPDIFKHIFKKDEKFLPEFLSLAEKENSGKYYDLYDFYLFYFAKHNIPSSELKNYALATFDEYDDDEIEKVLGGFVESYKKNQPIRSALPEGANILGFILPYIPSDADYTI